MGCVSVGCFSSGGYMNGCMMRADLYSYNWKTVMMCSCCRIGSVGVIGGDLVMILSIFFVVGGVVVCRWR